MSQRYLGGVITANPTTPTLSAATGVWTLEQQFQNVANWPKSTGLVSRSVRLRASVSAYFNRTVGTASNRKTFTFSGWVKKAVVGSSTGAVLFCSTDNSTSTGWLHFNAAAVGSADTLTFQDQLSSTVLVTTQLFRDPSAWYHIVLAVDTTQATASDRAKLYVNGTQVTAFSTATYPAQNADTNFNRPASFSHTIGTQVAGSRYFDGYLAEINFIDGQALTPSYFGFTDGDGVWQPATYSGTYGTNGFYLNFSDNSGATATTIGKDYSGNGNNWTPNVISVTAGATYDSMLDVPTPYADGGNGRGNYAVVNPLDFFSNPTVTNGNLQFATSGAGSPATSRATLGVSSGKWYWEVTQTAGSARGNVGIILSSTSLTTDLMNLSTGYAYNGISGNKYNNGTATAYGASYTNGDVIGVALDMDAGTIVFYKNNSSQGTAFTGLTGSYSPAFSDTGGANIIYAITFAVNFGQRPFTYTPPAGFVALNTQNLPASTISNGAAYMAATLYTGTGSALTIANTVGSASFQPDWVWVKGRSGATSHNLSDSVRGTASTLFSNTTGAENTSAQRINAFNSNGFSVGNDADVSTNTATYVGWQWNAGGSTVTNTSGSISAQIRANPTAGFSVVTWTSTGANATIGHGLGVAPKMVIVKGRSAISQWFTWHTGLTSGAYALILNLTDAQASYPTVFNSTTPTSSVFSVGTSLTASTTAVAYCFAEVAGYSAFGSYTGNNSADGPFVYTGFRPRWVLIKNTSQANDWFLMDSSRNTYNVIGEYLHPNSASATVTNSWIDFLSNGFKIRSTATGNNNSGIVQIYAAFAENPFKTSRAR